MTVKKETEGNRKQEDCSRAGISRINTSETAVLRKATYKFNAIPMQILMAFFSKLGKSILTLIWNHKKNPQTNKQQQQQP